MERQDRISYQRSEQTLYYRIVRQAAAGMLEEVVDVRFDKDREEVVAEFADGRLLPFSMLSDGQRNMLALAATSPSGWCASTFLLANRLQDTPGVVLIDELDLHFIRLGSVTSSMTFDGRSPEFSSCVDAFAFL